MSAVLSDDAVELAVQERRANQRASRLKPFDGRSLAWLALAPAWTEPLARACRFPLSGGDLEGFLAAAQDAGLCERSEPAGETAQFERDRARALSGLAPFLPGELLPQALAAARGLLDPAASCSALANLAPYAAEERPAVWAQARAAGGAIVDPQARAQALTDLAVGLPIPDRPPVLGDALAAVAAITGDAERAAGLLYLIPHLPAAMLPAALAVARGLAALRARGLAALVPYLPARAGGQPAAGGADALQAAAVAAEALTASSGMPGDRSRATVLISLLPYLEEPAALAAALDRLWTLPSVSRSVPDRRAAWNGSASGDSPADAALLVALAVYPALGLGPSLPDWVVDACRGGDVGGLLQRALASPLRVVRQGAAQTLGELEVQAAERPLIDALGDPEGPVRRAAATALGHSGSVAAVSRLGSLLHDAQESPGVRRAAAVALGQIKSSEAQALLAAAAASSEAGGSAYLADPEADAAVRLAAVAGLAGFPNPAVIATLAGLLADGDGEVRRAASGALGEIAGQTPLQADLWQAVMAALQGIPSEQSRAAALHALAPRLPDSALPAALNAAAALTDTGQRAEALCSLAPHLVRLPDLMPAALASALAIAPERCFVMPDATRNETLAWLNQPPYGQTFLQGEAVAAGQAILEARGRGLPVQPGTARWAEVARQMSGGASAAREWLREQVRTLVLSGDTGEALAWVQATAGVARALPELEAAVLLGNRQIELAYRRVQDERYLQTFLVRQDQVQAFDELLASPDAWALHYVGLGGAGKTMLLRYLIKVARDRGIPTARIDFDRISPDYPAQRPAQLLLELAEELRVYRTDESAAGLFNDHVTKLNETISGSGPGDEPLAGIHRPEFGSVLRAFTKMLGSLPQPVVLILDTTEELAKLQAPGAPLTAIEATLTILSQVHDDLPSVRVVFAGRRLLAQAGRDWHISDDVAGQFSALPPQQDYLRLFLIEGFDDSEATRYLQEIRGLRNLGAALDDAIRERCEQRRLPCYAALPITWEQPRPPGSDRRRYNPFDLSLYASWALDDKDLDAATIRTGKTDPYVELRIVGRLRRRGTGSVASSQTELALPLVVQLQRFDRSMLRPALDLDDAAFESLFLDLGSQEWIAIQPDQALDTTFLAVDYNLYPRLRAYYENEDRAHQFAQAAARLAPGLEAIVRSRSLGELAADHIAAALRVLPPDRAAALWEDVVRRVPVQRGWTWALQLTQQLLPGDDTGRVDAQGCETAPAPVALAAGLWVLRAAALVHSPTGEDPAAAWSAVERLAANYPDPDAAARLARRAAAGRIAALWPAGRSVAVGNMDAFWALLAGTQGPAATADRQLAAGMAAALAAYLDSREPFGTDAGAPPYAAIVRWADALVQALPAGEATDLAAFVRILAARALCAASGRSDELVARLREDAGAGLPADADALPAWYDWPRPAALRDHLRLQQLLLAARLYPGGLSTVGGAEQAERAPSLPGDWSGWLSEASQRLYHVDGDRLASLIVDLKLAVGVIPAEDLDSLIYAEENAYRQRQGEGRPQRPFCYAHDAVPPLIVSLARGRLALGKAQEALQLINARLVWATLAANQDRLVRDLNLARLEVIIRMRRAESSRSATVLESTQSPALQTTASWALEGLMGPAGRAPEWSPRSISAPGLLHARWRSFQPFNASAAFTIRFYTEWAAALDAALASPDATDAQRLTLALDRRELDLLRPQASRRPAERLTLDSKEWKEWQARHPADPDETTRLWLRIAALDDERPLAQVNLRAGPPARRVAELALEEGELLALRLPAQALPLLELAAQGFALAEDRAGRFIAATCAALTALRAGLAEDVARLMAEVEGAYTALTGDAPDLPAWDQLVAAAGQPTEEALRRLVGEVGQTGGSAPPADASQGTQRRPQPDWPDWLLRALAAFCPARAALRAGRAEEAPRRLVDEVGQTGGSTPPADAAQGTQRRPEPDWSGWLLRALAALVAAGRPDGAHIGREWLNLLKSRYPDGVPLELDPRPVAREAAAPAAQPSARPGMEASAGTEVGPAAGSGSIVVGKSVVQVGSVTFGGVLPAVLGVVLGLALIAGIFFGGFTAYRGIAGPTLQAASRRDQIWGFVAVALLLAALPWAGLYRALRGRRTAAGQAALVLLGLVAVFVAASWLIGRLAPAVGHIGSYVWAILLVPVAVQVAYRGWPRARRKVETLLAANRRVRLRIAPDQPDPPSMASYGTVTVRWQLQEQTTRLRPGWPPIYRVRLPDRSVATTPQPLAPYRQAENQAPADIAARLIWLHDELSRLGEADPTSQPDRLKLLVALRLHPALAGHAWEATLLLALAQSTTWRQRKSDALLPDRLMFWRTIGARRGPQPAAPDWAAPTVAVICAASWRLLAEQGWISLARPLAIDSNAAVLDRLPPVTILHLIGRPLRTSAGWQIQVESAALGARPQEKVAQQRGVTYTQAVGGGLADDLAAAWLVVVQAEPAGEASARSASDRELSADLRAYACSLVEGGARCVLVLPALPSVAASLLLAKLASALRGLEAAPDIRQLLNIIAGLREAVMIGGPPGGLAGRGGGQRAQESKVGPAATGETDNFGLPQSGPAYDRLEQALDICLFTAGEAQDGWEVLSAADE